MSEKKGVIFDFNGTLFFDNDKHVAAWSEMALNLRGYEISEKELHDHMNGRPNHVIVEYLCGKDIDPDKVSFLSREKERIYREKCRKDISNFHLVKGSNELFDLLKQNEIPFTIASASIKDNIDFFRISFNLDHWIDPTTIVFDDGSLPDKVEMFRKASRNLGVDLDDVIVIEDSLSGVRNAFRAGIGKIYVINSAGTPELFENMPGVLMVADNFEPIITELIKSGFIQQSASE